jgi:hypothetical protein
MKRPEFTEGQVIISIRQPQAGVKLMPWNPVAYLWWIFIAGNEFQAGAKA